MPDHTQLHYEKAIAHAAVAKRGQRRVVDGILISLTADPEVKFSASGAPFLQVRMEAHDSEGNRVHVDPDQRFMNPPLGKDVNKTFWEMLRDAVRTQAHR